MTDRCFESYIAEVRQIGNLADPFAAKFRIRLEMKSDKSECIAKGFSVKLLPKSTT